MKKLFLPILAIASACASTPKETAFDPASDPRLGDSVDRACFGSGSSNRGGSYMEIDGHPGFIIGDSRTKFFLLFSRGCGDLGNGSAFPLFTNYGDNCRRAGDRVDTVRDNLRVTGGCVIKSIYQWNEEEDGESDQGEEN